MDCMRGRPERDHTGPSLPEDAHGIGEERRRRRSVLDAAPLQVGGRQVASPVAGPRGRRPCRQLHLGPADSPVPTTVAGNNAFPSDKKSQLKPARLADENPV